MAALESWTKVGVPDNPSAWLYRAAHNHVVGELRSRARRERLAVQHAGEATDATEDAPNAFLAGDVRDDLVRMLFACCEDSIPLESQLVIALKTLCGFDVREIAERLFITEANVYKRLGRARADCVSSSSSPASFRQSTCLRDCPRAEWRGPVVGLAIVDGLQPPSWLVGSYLWAAVLADLHRRRGHDELAKRYRDAAIDSAPSPAVKDALARRLRTLNVD
jgi:predicted RNA polymerase sigma factor